MFPAEHYFVLLCALGARLSFDAVQIKCCTPNQEIGAVF